MTFLKYWKNIGAKNCLFYFNPEIDKEEEWRLPMKCINSNQDAATNSKVSKNLQYYFKIAMNNFLPCKKLCSKCYTTYNSSFLEQWYNILIKLKY